MNLLFSTPKETIDNIISTNLVGTIYCVKEAMPCFVKSRVGRIINFSAFAVKIGLQGESVYVASKAGVEGFTRSIARELAPLNVTVNCISAGPIKTLAASGIGDFRYIMKWNELNSPLRRNVTTEDVGKSGLYLLSDLSSGVTGETVHVDAGYHIVGMKAVDAPDIDVVTGKKEK